jgi:glycosyltransferase involved in cell wall biosynthesis
MLKALSNEGIETRVLCLTKGEAVEKEISDLGINVEWVGRSRNRLSRLREIVRNVQKRPVDILQSAHFFTNIYAALAGRALGTPSIGAIRGDLNQAIAANGTFGNPQLKWPRHLIANSQSAITEAIARGVDRKRIDFVRNVVDLSETTEKRESFARGHLNILFAGRLVSVKRPEIFLKLAAELRNDLPESDLRFHIAGDGPLRPQLEELAADLGLLPDDVRFLGERSEMTEVYRETDILVLTSEHEGTPNVVLEAMAHGIPVVATRVGGVPEVVRDECGTMVEPQDLEGLVNSVRTLILDSSLRQRKGKHAYDQVRKNHSFEYLQKRLPSIYSQALVKNNADG